MKLSTQFWLTTGALLCNLFAQCPSQAQIVPDATLPNNSSVKNQVNSSTISGGTKAGTNLFHSFEQFSIPTGGEAYFNNHPDIQNIISRVTGASLSNIDGLIRTNGAANLFLLNPNGIIFGPDARLNVGGSFLASTASSINFTDGTQFSARNPQSTPLLTVTVPLGLVFSNNPGGIRVLGNGHDVIASDYQPIIRGNNSTAGLQVQPQQTLAIVGGDVSLEGGILTAEGGRIDLGSVDNGQVSLSPTTSGWSLGYEGVTTFKDIRLAQRALVDASGVASGSIQVQGRRLQLSDGSLVLIQNQGVLPTGTLKVNASESLELREFGLSKGVYSGIWSESFGFGDGGEIAVSTPELTLQSSGQIFSATYGAAKAANITLSVQKSMRVIGLLPTEVGGGTIVGSLALGSGQSGDITISAGQLNIANGGVVLTANVTPVTSGVAAGDSGDITISATDLVEVNGTAPYLSVPSTISAATFSTGQAGNVTLNTSKLRVRNGGIVDSSTTAFGTAGSVTINASDSVEVSGVAPGSRDPSSVSSAATILDRSLQNTFRLFGDPKGAPGDVTINTGRLNVTNGGLVSVRNDGTGNGGNLQINADSFNLDTKGSITAATASGNGGNIFLKSNNLQLLRGSTITTDARGGSGNGGNITINTDTLAALENSDITAKAFEGQGGNILINTQGIFRSPDSDITASSQLGINGTVQINSLDINPSSATLQPVALPEIPEVADVCQRGSATSEFYITGTGGIPQSPSDPLSSMDGWHDNSYPAQSPQNTQSPERSSATFDDSYPAELPENLKSPKHNRATEPPREIVEAQGWIQSPDGTIILTAEAQGVVPYSSWSNPSCQQASSPRERP